jgi:hypothetical protein
VLISGELFSQFLSASVRGKVLPFRSRAIPAICYGFLQMDKKIFWLLFTVLGALMGFFLPLWWNLALTLPLLVFCWWVVYRSGWIS